MHKPRKFTFPPKPQTQISPMGNLNLGFLLFASIDHESTFSDLRRRIRGQRRVCRIRGVREIHALFLVRGGRRRQLRRIGTFVELDRVSYLEDLRRLLERSHLGDLSIGSLSGKKKPSFRKFLNIFNFLVVIF